MVPTGRCRGPFAGKPEMAFMSSLDLPIIGRITPCSHMRIRRFTMAAGKLAPTDSIDIPIQGMTCASCVGRVEKAIRSVAGVTAANVNLATERAHVEFAPATADPVAVADAIRAAGYEPSAATLDLTIEGMTCASCVSRVEKALERVPGVIEANVNLATERASVRYLGGSDVAEPADRRRRADRLREPKLRRGQHRDRPRAGGSRGRDRRPAARAAARGDPHPARLRPRNGLALRPGDPRLGDGHARAPDELVSAVRPDHPGPVRSGPALLPQRASRPSCGARPT